MKNNTKGSLILLLTTVLWGFTFVAQDLAMEVIRPYAFQSVRSLIGSLVLLPVIFVMDGIKKKNGTYIAPTREERNNLLLGGVVCGFCLCVASCLQQVGIAFGTSGGKAGFITAMYILFVPLFGLFIGKKVRPHIWLCVLLAGIGLYLLCMEGGEFGFATGDLLVLGCAVAFGFQILAVDHFAPRVDCLKLSALQFLVSGLLSSIPMFLFEGAKELTLVPAAIGPILFAGVLSCGVAYTLQTIGQKYTEPAIASLIMSFEAFFAALAGALVAVFHLFDLPGSMLTTREFIGCGVMLVAILLSQANLNWGKRK